MIGDAFRECRRIMEGGPPRKKDGAPLHAPIQKPLRGIYRSKARAQILRETPLRKWLHRQRRLAGRQQP
jgi:hypothetical protein